MGASVTLAPRRPAARADVAATGATVVIRPNKPPRSCLASGQREGEPQGRVASLRDSMRRSPVVILRPCWPSAAGRTRGACRASRSPGTAPGSASVAHDAPPWPHPNRHSAWPSNVARCPMPGPGQRKVIAAQRRTSSRLGSQAGISSAVLLQPCRAGVPAAAGIWRGQTCHRATCPRTSAALPRQASLTAL